MSSAYSLAFCLKMQLKQNKTKEVEYSQILVLGQRLLCQQEKYANYFLHLWVQCS